MSLPFTRAFRLAGRKGDGRHAYANPNGAFLGRGVPLLERDRWGRWKPRDRAVLERLFTKGYGTPIDLGWPMRQLGYVAHALNKGDLCLASISLVHMELSPLPSIDRARAMAKADGMLAKFNPDWENEPRVAAGDPAGGQWTDGASTDDPPAAANEHGHDVIIRHSDGSTETRTGGSHTWRSDNPGAIEAGDFANDQGAIGAHGGLTVFPDEATGEAAQSALLTSVYGNSTIDQMIEAWAPPKENNTARYQALVNQWTGLPGNTRVGDLTPAQLASVMAAQRRMEGWWTGTVIRSGP